MLPFIPLEKFWSLLITTNGCFLEVREYYCVSQQNLSVGKKTSLFSFETRFEIQGRRKFWKSGVVSSNMVGIICPPGWDRVNWSAKICSDRPEIDGLYPWEIEFSKTVSSSRVQLLIHWNVLFHRPLREDLNKTVCFMTMTNTAWNEYNPSFII